MQILGAEFFARATVHVARDLLGKLIVRRRPGAAPLVARIVEVEAYLGVGDGASHARRGPTPRTAIMFGPPGKLYVYLVYGMHHCMNVVTERDGVAGAVLLRAAEPLDGSDAATLRGPGKLCAGLGITVRDNAVDLTAVRASIRIAGDGYRPPKIAASARIGVDYAGVWARRKLRFFMARHPSVSGPSRARRPRVRSKKTSPGSRPPPKHR